MSCHSSYGRECSRNFLMWNKSCKTRPDHHPQRIQLQKTVKAPIQPQPTCWPFGEYFGDIGEELHCSKGLADYKGLFSSYVRTRSGNKTNTEQTQSGQLAKLFLFLNIFKILCTPIYCPLPCSLSFQLCLY